MHQQAEATCRKVAHSSVHRFWRYVGRSNTSDPWNSSPWVATPINYIHDERCTSFLYPNSLQQGEYSCFGLCCDDVKTWQVYKGEWIDCVLVTYQVTQRVPSVKNSAGLTQLTLAVFEPFGRWIFMLLWWIRIKETFATFVMYVNCGCSYPGRAVNWLWRGRPTHVLPKPMNTSKTSRSGLKHGGTPPCL